ncbi:hypothetical protein [Cellulosimicrobium sp. CUA-896]|uniref:hypothetical protein n=1 Tax=Cellulosimicrobium sp. CUA-896 TaxID=1517881 RepID=UPI00111509F8|nr:hypothetical protein [Cellulosimicrobium sp. CUA-896]
MTLRGVVTHVAGRRVAFEYHHPERGLWHLWVADHTCFPVGDADVYEPTGTAVGDHGPDALRTRDPRGCGRESLVAVGS